MKTSIKLLLVIVFLTVSYASGVAKGEGYEIKIKIKGLQDTVIYVGHHFGDKKMSVDTLQVDKKGNAVLKGEENLKGGIYFVYTNVVLFEFLIGEQKFSVETDTTNYQENLKFTGSLENKNFSDFNKFYAGKRKLITELQSQLKTENKEKAKEKLTEEIKQHSLDIEDYMSNVIEKYPKSLMTLMFKSNRPIKIPESPKDENGNEIDSLFALKYHQKHYFDNLDFSDERLLRTPILHQKMFDYLKRLTYPHPDSIIKSVDVIVEKAKANEEVFHYVISTLTYHYETSKYMGMDAIFVHIAKKYYLSGMAEWADSTMLSKIQDRVWQIEPTIIGRTAYEMNLLDTTLTTRHSLHALPAQYTVVFLYDPGCGHCKKMASALIEKYDTIIDLGAEIYGVCTSTDIDEWKKLLHKKAMPWLNVADPYAQSHFRSYYDVQSTPIIYLLDERKKILAKKISVDQLVKFLLNEEKRNK